MELFSLDSVILIIMTCNKLFGIFIFKVDFSETDLMTSAENSVSEPPNLNIFWWRIPPDPPTRLLAIMLPRPPPPLPPRYKKPSHGPAKWEHKWEQKIEDNLKCVYSGEGCSKFMSFQIVYCLQWAGNTFQMKHRLLFLNQGLELCLDPSTFSSF